MPVERSAGAVIYRQTKKGREYLLIQHQDEVNKRTSRPARPVTDPAPPGAGRRHGRLISNGVKGHWDFPKGHIEKGETTEETVRREVREETGLSRIEFIPGFKETIRYFVNFGNEKRLKFVVFFLAKAPARAKIKISREHQDFIWLPYKEAYEYLTYRNAKEVVEKAEEFLTGTTQKRRRF